LSLRVQFVGQVYRSSLQN